MYVCECVILAEKNYLCTYVSHKFSRKPCVSFVGIKSSKGICLIIAIDNLIVL